MASLNGEALDVSMKNFITKCATALSKSLSKRFRFVRDATSPDFMALPSAATLLDLRHNWILLLPANAALFTAAKKYVLDKLNEMAGNTRSVTVEVHTDGTGNEADEDSEPSPKRFKCLAALAANVMAQVQRANQGGHDEQPVELEFTTYIHSLLHGDQKRPRENADIIALWNMKKNCLPTLASFAVEILSLPCSEAYVERLFSTCGLLTNGRRNKMSKSLEKRVFLKHNLPLL